MDLNRKGSKITIGFDSEDDAKALYAIMSGEKSLVTEEVFAQGHYMYSWLFTNIQRLALNYPQEAILGSQSPETMDAPKKKKR